DERMGSIINSITQHAELVPNKIAIQEKNQTRTYAQLMDNAQRVATGLKNTELPNKRVAILSKNCIEFIEVFLGAIFSGYVPLLLDTKWSEKEVKSVLRLHKTGIIFGDSTILDTLSTTLVPEKISFQSHSGSMWYEDWLLQRKKTMEQTSHELLFIGFTSGTTGIPKGYNRTHDSWIHSFEASTEIFGINQGDHFIAPGGFTHSLSLFVLIQSLYLGATFHIVPKFQPKHIQALCNKLPNVVLFVVPTMIQSLLTELTYPLHLKALISSGSQWTTEMKAKAAKQFECNQM